MSNISAVYSQKSFCFIKENIPIGFLQTTIVIIRNRANNIESATAKYRNLSMLKIVENIKQALTNSFNSFLTTSSFSCIISLDMFLISFRMFVVVTSFYQSFRNMSILLPELF